MQVILEAVEGPAVGTRLLVRQGQIVRVGRTEWADYSLPADEELSEIHFELDFAAEGCCLRSQGGAVTKVNGEPATEVWLREGDQVTAGQTTFTVHMPQGMPQSDLDEADGSTGDEAASDAAAEEKSPETAADYCQRIKLSDDAGALLTDELLPPEYLQALTDAEKFPDALKFLAVWLPKPEAVRWACGCVGDLLGDQFGDKDTAAIEAAEAWAAEPEEKQRRAAEAAAKACDQKGPAYWLAQAAFWSGGSLTPPDMAEVPPEEGLTARGIAAALVMAATADPSQTKQRYRAFLDEGRTLADALAVG